MENDDKSAAVQIGVVFLVFLFIGVALVIIANLIA